MSWFAKQSGKDVIRIVRPMIAGLLFLSAPASAKPATDLAAKETAFWRTAAKVDIAAAYAMLKADHPAAAVEIGDTFFQTVLETAYALAVKRADAVKDLPGYNATMTGFANAFHDAHLRARPYYTNAQPEWAGLVVNLRAGKWIVVDQDQRYATRLVGHEVIACGGKPVAELAAATLGAFKVNWNSEAERALAAPWLFVNDGNPFVQMPRECVLSAGGATVTLPIAWKRMPLSELLEAFNAHQAYGHSGFGVEKVENGYWIAIESFDIGAPELVRQVRAAAMQLKRVDYVILDLRGNHGGSAIFGDQIAAAILGEAYVDRVLGQGVGC